LFFFAAALLAEAAVAAGLRAVLKVFAVSRILLHRQSTVKRLAGIFDFVVASKRKLFSYLLFSLFSFF